MSNTAPYPLFTGQHDLQGGVELVLHTRKGNFEWAEGLRAKLYVWAELQKEHVRLLCADADLPGTNVLLDSLDPDRGSRIPRLYFFRNRVFLKSVNGSMLSGDAEYDGATGRHPVLTRRMIAELDALISIPAPAMDNV